MTSAAMLHDVTTSTVCLRTAREVGPEPVDHRTAAPEGASAAMLEDDVVQGVERGSEVLEDQCTNVTFIDCFQKVGLDIQNGGLSPMKRPVYRLMPSLQISKAGTGDHVLRN